MSGNQFSRLRWIRPAPPEPGVVSLVEAEAPMTPTARALMEVGLPTAPPPHNQSALAEARYLLRAAAEIEHGLLLLYLYTAYSCTAAAGQTPGKIVRIAKEEMGHLICMQNLLLAVGANPYFGRQDFPTTPRAGTIFPFALILEPLSLGSLAKFVTTESPPPHMIGDPAMRDRVEPVFATAKAAAGETINHVGPLFVALYWLLKLDDTPPTDADWLHYPTDQVLRVHEQLGRHDWHVKDGEFRSAGEMQDLEATDAEPWGGSDAPDSSIYVRRVLQPGAGLTDATIDRAHMLKTLHLIAEQGEGWELPTDPTPSHFIRFLTLFEQLKAAVDAGGAVPAAEVPTAPTTIPPADPTAPLPENLIANPEALLWAELFNARYRIVLLELALVMATPRPAAGDGPLVRESLIDRAVHQEMTQALRPLAKELVKMRRQGVPADGPTTKRAAPPFELPADALPDLANMGRADVPDALKAALAVALAESRDLVGRIKALPADLLDAPANRGLLDDMLAMDEDLEAALGGA